jgi:hypothetical protein
LQRIVEGMAKLIVIKCGSNVLKKVGNLICTMDFDSAGSQTIIEADERKPVSLPSLS